MQDIDTRGPPSGLAADAYRLLLDEVGARMDEICKVKIWVIDRAYLAPVTEVVGRHLKGIPVATSEVIVDGLARPEMLMEIDVEVVRA